MALKRQATPEMTCPLLTETARLWHCPLGPSEPYPICRLAGRLDSSLALCAGLPLRSAQDGEQALDLRVTGRRRADSLERSPSPTESEATTASPGRSPLGARYPGGRRDSSGGFSSLAGSPTGMSGIPGSPPTPGHLYYTAAVGGSACGSPPRLGSVCSSPASPESPERVTGARHTSVIRRLVLDRPQSNEPSPRLEYHHLQQRSQLQLQPPQTQQPQKPQLQTQEEQQRLEQQQHEQEQQQQEQLQQAQAQYPCEQCGRKYSTASNLARHKQLHCLPSDKKARKCPECDKVYVSMPAYSMHVRTHAQGCRCPYCGKAFSRPWLLQGHVRTHTGERPFRCSVCAKAFADKSNLRAHVQTHSNVKPHVCTRCGKAFALKSYLYKHEESSCMKERKTSRGAKESESKVKVETQGGV